MLGEVDVLSILTAATHDKAGWRDPDPEVIDAVATLLGLLKKSAVAAKAAFHRLHGAVADAQPAPAGEDWDYDKGTSPGEGADPAARNAEIVRRIRELCPDNRPRLHPALLNGREGSPAIAVAGGSAGSRPAGVRVLRRRSRASQHVHWKR